MGIIAAAAIAGTAAIAGGVISANAQKSAADKNAQSQSDANSRNYQMFQESRGSDGSAVLPLYLRNANGTTFEQQMGNDSMAAYDAYHQGTGSLTGYQKKADAFAPAIAGAQTTTNDIFNGGVGKQMQSNFAPVAAARLQYKRGAAIDAMSKTIQDINAIQTGRGYSGDSLGSQMLKFQGRKAAGDEVANANVANAEDVRNINDQALSLKLNSLNLPYQQATQAMNFANLPQNTYIDQLMKEQSPMRFFYMGQGNAPQVQPVTTAYTPSAASVALGGVAQEGGSLYGKMMQQQQQQQYMDLIKGMNSKNVSPAVANYSPSDYGQNNFIPSVYNPQTGFNDYNVGATGNAGYG